MIAIDLGSNSLRVLKFDCKTKQKIFEFQRGVKTADGLHQSGKISQEAIQRIIQALNDAKHYVDFDDVIVAVTTEAMRKASNSKEALEMIALHSGVEFSIIDGLREAHLTLKAVSNMLLQNNIQTENFVIFDLGGGSSELSYISTKQFDSRSFPLGIVTMAQKYPDMLQLQIKIKEELSELKAFAAQFSKPEIFIATAGTPTTIASFVQGYDYARYSDKHINGYVLSKQQTQDALEKLLNMDLKQREKWVGIHRSDLIIAGVYIFLEVMEICGFEEVITCDDSLSVGVALQNCS